MRLGLLSLLIVLPYWASAQAGKRDVVDIKIVYDTTKSLELDYSFPIGLHVQLGNGQIRKTVGLAEGIWSWNRFQVEVQNGLFRNGIIYYDRQEVYKHGNQLSISVSLRKDPTLQRKLAVPIPYLTEFRVSYDSSAYLSPGFKIPLRINARYSDGKSRAANSLGWENFAVRTNGTLLKEAYVYVPSSLEVLPQKLVLEATYLRDTTLTHRLEIPLHYRAPYTFEASGINGQRGADSNNASGNSGQDGRDGQHGGNGQKGGQGSAVKVYAKSLVRPDDTLLQIKIVAGVQLKKLVLDPKGGSLQIICNGGTGGQGGTGGNGSDGLAETEKASAVAVAMAARAAAVATGARAAG
jgi:hypothetical protein